MSLLGFDNLEKLDCSNNFLTDIDFKTLSPKKLKYLRLTNNDFSERDLTFFSDFTSLEHLFIGNWPSSEKSQKTKNNYNRFFGSLKPLQNLTKLKRISIRHTNIDSGLEYLPTNLEKIIHLTEKDEKDWKGEEWKVIKLEKELESCKIIINPNSGYRNYYDYPKWVNEERLKILFSIDKLSLVQNSLNEFYTKWKVSLQSQDELDKIKIWINWLNYSKELGFYTKIFGAGIAIKYSAVGSPLAFSGIVLEGLSGKIKKKVRTREKILQEKLVEELDARFISATKNLKKTYQELIEIFQKLSLFSSTPTSSEKINSSFNIFLEKVAELRENTNLYNVDDSVVEQGMNEKLAIKFTQDLQSNWQKYKIDKVIDGLRQEVNSYCYQQVGQEFSALKQEQQQAQIEQPPK